MRCPECTYECDKQSSNCCVCSYRFLENVKNLENTNPDDKATNKQNICPSCTYDNSLNTDKTRCFICAFKFLQVDEEIG